MSDRRVSFADGVDRDAAIGRASEAFRRHGVVVLDDLVDPAVLERCHAEIARDHPDFERRDPTRDFGTYPGRYTRPLPVANGLADRLVFCPPVVLDIVARLFGEAGVMDSFGLLVSLPGAEDQKRHADALLFPETPIDRMLPPVAIALAMPLVRMDETSGSTGFWSGSHRNPKPDDEQDFAPIVPIGSALLWDFRVHHRGLANRSARPRPVLFSVFCREWWTEAVPPDAIRHEKLTIAPVVHAALSRRMQRIVRRARVGAA